MIAVLATMVALGVVWSGQILDEAREKHGSFEGEKMVG